jgi:hypothetical protein
MKTEILLYQPWLFVDAVVVPRIQHEMPKRPEKFLPKFDPKKNDSVENHIKKFLLVVRLQRILHQDIVCCLFPLTFKEKYSTWYFSLEEASIPI